MIKFTVPMEMELEAWKDHVLGSGAFSWEWWIDYHAGEKGVQAVWYDDADNPDESGTPEAWISYQEIANVASDLAETDKFVANQLVNDDFDADGMDRVLQMAFIGEIRYG
jgi:hypothetical protein